MLHRLISRHSHLRILTLISAKNSLLNPNPRPLHNLPFSYPNPSSNLYFSELRHFSSKHLRNGGHDNNGNNPHKSASDVWKLSTGNGQTVDSVFGEDDGGLEGISSSDEKPVVGVFKGIDVDQEVKGSADGDGVEDWATADGYKPWSLAEDEEGNDVFGIGEEVFQMPVDAGGDDERKDIQKGEEDKVLEEEEKLLSTVLKGPNRAFGDLVAVSGITEEMLDSLMVLKDLDGVQGLPPLSEIEDMRYEKNTRKSTRAEIERQKQEEVAKARVRQVDDKGRAYGTGRRKCSVARVWIQSGDGKFIINDKEFDVYFPMLDHRAALLRPFSETKTLGLWDVTCTVKGGGVSGQVGAVQLGISRALQNWEPGLRPPLRAVGFLTRDPRVVERKKPGKAKARKSFQWVKR